MRAPVISPEGRCQLDDDLALQRGVVAQRACIQRINGSLVPGEHQGDFSALREPCRCPGTGGCLPEAPRLGSFTCVV